MSQKYKAKANEIVTVVDKDAIDSLMFDSMRTARKVSEICKDEEAEGLVQDAFTSFFSHDPKLVEEGEPVQAGVVEQLMALPEFKDLRVGTSMDEISSAIAACEFAPDMIVKYQELKKKMEERQKEAQKNGQQGPKNLKEALSDQEMSSLRNAMRKGLQKAQQKSDEWGDVCAGWGIEKGELQKLPAGKRMELAEKLTKTDKLKRIADLAGRFANIVNSHSATTPIHGVDEIVDIGIGNDIGRLLPSEIVKMIENPDQFDVDYTEGKLLCYNLRGIEELGRGPIIVCLDMSGSMSGSRDEWSKAVALSLLRLAEKQKRSFGFIGFDSAVQYTKFFPKGTPITAEAKMEIATVFSGGGTEFLNPLKAAFALRDQDPSLKPADIIFITDGEAYIDPDQLSLLLEKKKQTEMRIYGIAIDCYETKTLQGFCDQVAGVNLNGDVQIDLVRDLISKTASQAMSGTQSQGQP